MRQPDHETIRTGRTRIASLFLLACALGACTAGPPTVEIASQTSKDAGELSVPSKVCVTASLDDIAARGRLEQRVVARLGAAGLEALPWTELFFIGNEYSDDELRERLTAAGADHVLALEVKRMWTDERVVPTTTTAGYYGGGWNRYHYSGWQTTYVNGGYTVSLPRALYEARLIRCADREVVWIGSFRVEGSSSHDWRDLQKAAGEQLVPRLIEDGFIEPVALPGSPADD